jgi:hypothetical protein
MAVTNESNDRGEVVSSQQLYDRMMHWYNDGVHVDPDDHETDKIRKHIRTCGIPVSTRRAIFNDKCKSRRQRANQWERHTVGRVQVNKEKPKYRNCHS